MENRSFDEGKVYIGYTPDHINVTLVEKLIARKLGLYMGRGTVALKIVGDDFVYGIAMCDEKDQFAKKYGTELATSRLERGFRKTPIKGDFKLLADSGDKHQASIAFLRQLLETVNYKPNDWKRKIEKFEKEHLRMPGTISGVIEGKKEDGGIIKNLLGGFLGL